MHVIHHVEAIVIKSLPAGEANKRVWLFTKEFGYITAIVQGVRKSEAKLQSHISEYSFIAADLVRGKEVWRLINAEVVDVPLEGVIRTPLARSFVRTLSAIDRFLMGEAPHEALFNHLKEIAGLIGKKDIDAKTFDALSLWKMLAMFGYIAPTVSDEVLLVLPFAQALTHIDEPTRVRMVRTAEEAIKESQL